MEAVYILKNVNEIVGVFTSIPMIKRFIDSDKHKWNKKTTYVDMYYLNNSSKHIAVSNEIFFS